MRQSTNKILMIKPVNFSFNKETAKDNLYQNKSSKSNNEIQNKALEEFSNFTSILKSKGVDLIIFEDTNHPYTPDSIFPNNWFSTHNGTLCIYPMFAENRREEIFKFKNKLIDIYNPMQIFDFSKYAYQNSKFLEGTGAIIFDRVNKRAFCSLSKRADKELFLQICKSLNYNGFTFKSFHLGGEIYHTNVMMSICSDFIFVASKLIDENDRENIISELSKYHKIIELTSEQILNFAGNVLELQGNEGKFIVMSNSAYNILSSEQKEVIESTLPIVKVNIETIEKIGGGSARCMMGEIF
ncbi:citrulline utilization hydrolase CtlX [Helcococcus bovis]|uniref:citrulline utilization hydrolase CtlX n=1 Tax=Helcococcus bovis TaxID=3153252 RepID=UPI0038BA46DC